MITPYSEFLERRERRQRVAAALAQPDAVPAAAGRAGEPGEIVASVAVERPAAAERPLPNPHTDANGFRTLERAT